MRVERLQDREPDLVPEIAAVLDSIYLCAIIEDAISDAIRPLEEEIASLKERIKAIEGILMYK